MALSSSFDKVILLLVIFQFVFVTANFSLVNTKNFAAKFTASAYDSVLNVGFYGNQDGNIYIVNAATGDLIKSFTPGGKIQNIWVEPAVAAGEIRRAIFCTSSQVYVLYLDANLYNNPVFYTRYVPEASPIRACIINFQGGILSLIRDSGYFSLRTERAYLTKEPKDQNFRYTSLDKSDSFVDIVNEGVAALSDDGSGWYASESTEGRLLKINFNNKNPSAVNMGFGSYGVIIAEGNKLYLGNNYGVGLVMNPANKDILNIFYTNEGSFTMGVSDKERRVTYWGTTSSSNPCNIYRYNSDWEEFDSIAVSGRNCFTGVFDPSSLTLLVGDAGSTAALYNIRVAACGTDACASCIQAEPSYCGWCYTSTTCVRSNTACGTSSNFEQKSDSCPALTSLTPTSGAISGNTLVTVTGTNFVNGLTYKCSFNGVQTAAVRRSNTQLQCRSPAVSGSGDVNVEVYTTGKWASNSLTYNYYDCNAGVGCQACISAARPECGWCLSSASCGIESGTCVSGDPDKRVEDVSVCPKYSISPRSASAGLGQVNVVITGGNFIPGTYQVQVGTNATNRFAVTRQSNSSMTATINKAAFPVGDYAVVLILGSRRYIQDPLGFTFYDCQKETSCSSCTDPIKECSWCSETQTCTFSGGCDATNPASTTCPGIVSVNPPSALLPGGVDVTITFNTPLPSTGDLACVFQGAAAVTATRASSTAIKCVCPASPSGDGEVPLAVTFQGRTYANSTTFRYFDCSGQTSCTSCMDPLLIKACFWCMSETAGGCQLRTAASCDANLRSNGTCPSIDVLSPNRHIIRERSQLPNITITGGYFPLSENYLCQFDSGNFSLDIETNASIVVLPATYINTSTIQCPLPPLNPALTSYDVPLATRIMRGDKVYTDAPATFYYYDCNSEWNNCDSCLSHSYCGWCLSSQSANCAPQEYCSASIWINQVCPRVYSVEPSYALIEGGVTITINGTAFVNVPGIVCKFGNDSYVNATYVSNTTLTCVSPDVSAELAPTPSTETSVTDALPTSTETGTEGMSTEALFAKRADGDYIGSLGFDLEYQGTPFSTDSIEFNFIECSQHTDCRSCEAATSTLCGWCLTEARCLPNYMCDRRGNPIETWQTSQCPLITEVSPVIGSIEGGTEVTIKGDLFINDPELIVLFGGVRAKNVQIKGPSEIAAEAPASNEPTQIDIQIIYKDKAYTSNQVKWNYIDAGNSGLGTTGTALIIAFAVVLAAGLGIGVAVCVVYRRKQKSKRINLVTPKYDQIAFANFMTHQYEKKGLSEFKTLEELIVLPDKLLPVALANITQSTESDNLAKCLVYVFEDHNQTLDMILTFIDMEVSNSKQETLFRQNSIVTKMFKFYSRMIGIEYLFNTLARYIAELDWASNQGEKGENSLLETSIEMEVDPNKMGEDDDEQVNKLQLMLVVQKIFSSVMKSYKNIPSPILTICTHVKRAVAEKFPGFEYKAMSAFFFLRLICPSLAAPQAYGLLPNAPSPSAQRQLVLLSKVLQMLANGQRFGKKEEFMVKLNDFIDDNELALQKFYDNFPQQHTTVIEPHDVPKVVKENSLVWIHSHIVLNKGKLDAEFQKPDFEDGKPVKEKLDQVIQELGTPAEKLKTTSNNNN